MNKILIKDEESICEKCKYYKLNFWFSIISLTKIYECVNKKINPKNFNENKDNKCVYYEKILNPSDKVYDCHRI